jgi:hypothetical protein
LTSGHTPQQQTPDRQDVAFEQHCNYQVKSTTEASEWHPMLLLKATISFYAFPKLALHLQAQAVENATMPIAQVAQR